MGFRSGFRLPYANGLEFRRYSEVLPARERKSWQQKREKTAPPQPPSHTGLYLAIHFSPLIPAAIPYAN
jgi:hypothetical protein